MAQTAPSPSPIAQSKKTGPLEPAKVDRTPVVKRNVLNALGTPPNMHSIKATNVWGDNYRITIFVKIQDPRLVIPGEKIGHSFFLKVNENGDILKSDPPLKKEYE